MFNKPKAPPPIVAKVAEQLSAMNMPQMAITPRPFLDAIRKDRIEKQIEMNRLEREISKLWELERFADSHETADALVRYFLEKQNAPIRPSGQ